MFKYNGVNFIKTVYRPYLPFMATLFFVGFKDRANWKKFIGLNYQLLDGLCIEGVYYYPEYHLQAFAGKAVKYIFKDQKNFLHLKKETLRREKNVLSKNKKTDFTTFFKAYLEYQPALALYHICDDFIENGLRKELLKKTSDVEVDELMSHLNLPLELNLDQRAKRWFLKTEDVDGFIKKYSWYFSRFGHHLILNRQKAQSFLNSLKKDKDLQAADKKRLVTRKAITRAKKLLGPKAHYVDVMQFFVYYRTQRTDILNQVFFNYYDQLVSLAARLNISYDDLIHCSFQEIVDKKIPSKKVLSARKKEFAIIMSLGEIGVVSGAKLNYFKKLCKEKHGSKLISGRTAFPGRVTGVVRLIKTTDDLNNFKPGEILVAAMTTPSMVMIMKKAAAFITDEGGITCHAAILARELKKPCVIGTHKATSVLRDGDQVEVDADKGIVKIKNK